MLADGRVMHASQSSHSDLFKALRGGGANFGIVTDLELYVYTYEGMWGGSMAWAWDHGDTLIDAFIEYGMNNAENVDAAVILAVINLEGEWVYHADVEHLKPTPACENPTLKRFLDIPALENNTGPTDQVQRADGILDHYPSGANNGYWTFCTQVDRRIIKFFFEVWRETVTPILDIEGLERSALADVNIASQNTVNAMRKDGGNALGLAYKGPFLVFLMEPLWMKSRDSPRVWACLRSTAMRTQAEARRLGLHLEYIYLNYANPYQDVYTGYGEAAKEFLTTVSRKYDSDGIFQNQRGAGWHLRGALEPWIALPKI